MPDGLHWYDREGKPLSSIEEWGARFSDEEYQRVAQTQVGPYLVSTVWLGLDHNYGEGPPLIFETMVFATSAEMDGLGPDLDCHRWPTEAEAKVGHEEIVTLVRATLQEQPNEVEAERDA